MRQKSGQPKKSSVELHQGGVVGRYRRSSIFPVGAVCEKPTQTEEPPMTDDMMNLLRLVEKTPDANLLREMIGFAASRVVVGCVR